MHKELLEKYQKTGDVITFPYTEVVTIQQPYATRIENLNPVLNFSWAGICELSPSGDEWFEVNRFQHLLSIVRVTLIQFLHKIETQLELCGTHGKLNGLVLQQQEVVDLENIDLLT